MFSTSFSGPSRLYQTTIPEKRLSTGCACVSPVVTKRVDGSVFPEASLVSGLYVLIPIKSARFTCAGATCETGNKAIHRKAKRKTREWFMPISLKQGQLPDMRLTPLGRATAIELGSAPLVATIYPEFPSCARKSSFTCSRFPEGIVASTLKSRVCRLKAAAAFSASWWRSLARSLTENFQPEQRGPNNTDENIQLPAVER